MSQAAPTVLTVILNYRTPELTLRAAEAALREMQGIPGGLVIVDNDSGDDSFALLRAQAEARGWTAAGRVRVLQSGRNRGFGGGMNFGIAAGLDSGAAPDLVYLLNSDAFPDPGCIRALVDTLGAHPRAGFACSYVHGPDGAPHQTAFRFPTIAGELEQAARIGLVSRLLSRWIIPLPMPERLCRVDWSAGASMMIRRAMLDEIGGFDETFFLYYEETDLCLRGARAGWQTLYVPDSSITHIGSASTGMKSWTRTPGYWFDSRLHYFTKNHGRAYAAGATLARIAGTLLWRLRRTLSSRPEQDPEGFLGDLTRHAWRRLAAPARTAAPLGDTVKETRE